MSLSACFARRPGRPQFRSRTSVDSTETDSLAESVESGAERPNRSSRPELPAASADRAGSDRSLAQSAAPSSFASVSARSRPKGLAPLGAWTGTARQGTACTGRARTDLGTKTGVRASQRRPSRTVAQGGRRLHSGRTTTQPPDERGPAELRVG